MRNKLFVLLVRRVEDEGRARTVVREKVDAGFAESAVDEITAGSFVAGALGGNDDAPLLPQAGSWIGPVNRICPNSCSTAHRFSVYQSSLTRRCLTSARFFPGSSLICGTSCRPMLRH